MQATNRKSCGCGQKKNVFHYIDWPIDSLNTCTQAEREHNHAQTEKYILQRMAYTEESGTACVNTYADRHTEAYHTHELFAAAKHRKRHECLVRAAR